MKNPHKDTTIPINNQLSAEIIVTASVGKDRNGKPTLKIRPSRSKDAKNKDIHELHALMQSRRIEKKNRINYARNPNLNHNSGVHHHQNNSNGSMLSKERSNNSPKKSPQLSSLAVIP